MGRGTEPAEHENLESDTEQAEEQAEEQPMTAVVAAAACGRQRAFSTEQAEQLRALPGPMEAFEDAAWCDLESGHAGPHVGFAQMNATTWWWLRWTDAAGVGELVAAGFCGARPDQGAGDCVLPSDHPGRHSFELDHAD